MGARGPQPSDQTARIRRMATMRRWRLPDGSPNKSAIAAEVGVSRQRVQAILRSAK